MSRIAVPPAAAQTGRVLCAANPERMFPLEESQRAGQEPTAGERRAMCRRCPVLQRCREAVLELSLPYGVAGGLTAAQRRRIRAQRAGHGDGQRLARRAAGAMA